MNITENTYCAHNNKHHFCQYNVSGIVIDIECSGNDINSTLQLYGIHAIVGTVSDPDVSIFVSDNEVMEKLVRTNVLKHGEQWKVRPNPIVYSIFLEDKHRLISSVSGHTVDHSIIVENDKITIVASNADSEELAFIIVRVVREVVLRKRQNAGAIFVHAAVVSRPIGKGTLFLGSKGAGKTSCMARFVAFNGCSYLANDRCFLENKAGSLIASGWPLSIRMGLGLIQDSFPQIAQGYKHLRRHQSDEVASALNELISNGKYNMAKAWNSNQKIELLPAELANFLQCSIVQSVEIDSVVLAQISPDGLGTVAVSAWDTIGDDLRNDFFRSPFDHDYPIDWLGLGSDGPQIAALELIKKELSSMPLYVASGNPCEVIDGLMQIIAT